MTSNPSGLVALFQNAISNNEGNRALSDYGGISLTYGEVGDRIRNLHLLFDRAGLQPGDKVALLGKNSANWGVIYLATVMYGAVIVPILPDFKAADVHFIVNHSDALVLFVEDTLFPSLDMTQMTALRKVVRIHDTQILVDRSTLTDHPQVREPAAGPPGRSAGGDDLAVISYTSGTTGFSKGVMLPHRSLLGNLLYAQRNMPLNPGDRILSFLPLAHTYGCAFEFLFPFTLGCDITFLTKTPSPKIIMQAFQEIRPALILSVPLVIEKIFKTQLLPVIRKPLMRILLSIPGLNTLLYNKIRGKMVAVFGGNFRELVIGGAPFNTEAEAFFTRMKFPFTVGYGMTECGPLISYASWKTTCPGASGRAVDELEVRIDSPDPSRIAGEILMRGSHVMLGYYKNEEATRAVIDADGWLHSGDLGIIDKKGNIHIRGRSKSMILGPSGKNIYPEEIESVLNNRFMVMESLVLERNEKLVALIYPDFDAVERSGHTRADLEKVFAGYLRDLNHHMPKYIHISGFEIVSSEFEKTPKRSIKRFLYQ